MVCPPPFICLLGPFVFGRISFVSFPFPPGPTPQTISIQYHIPSSFHFHCHCHLATSRLTSTSAIQLLVLKTPGVVVIPELVTILAGTFIHTFVQFSFHFIHSNYMFLCLSGCVGKTSLIHVFTVICAKLFNLKSYTITSMRHTPGAISNNYIHSSYYHV